MNTQCWIDFKSWEWVVKNVCIFCRGVPWWSLCWVVWWWWWWWQGGCCSISLLLFTTLESRYLTQLELTDTHHHQLWLRTQESPPVTAYTPLDQSEPGTTGARPIRGEDPGLQWWCARWEWCRRCCSWLRWWWRGLTEIWGYWDKQSTYLNQQNLWRIDKYQIMQMS